jgi:hypothetical protein
MGLSDTFAEVIFPAEGFADTITTQRHKVKLMFPPNLFLMLNPFFSK